MGKTTSIKYLLERVFPGPHIGPEPTTDRFLAVMHGKEDMIIPGYAIGNSSRSAIYWPFKVWSRFLEQISRIGHQFPNFGRHYADRHSRCFVWRKTTNSKGL